MKSWTLHFRAVDKENFDALCSGIKTIETRAATEKYRYILPGDILALTCDGENMDKLVESVTMYPSIEAMLENIHLKDVMPQAKTLEEAKKQYYSYPGYEEKIAENGIVALRVVDLPPLLRKVR